MGYIRTVDNIYGTSELVKCEDKRVPNGWFTKNGVPLIAIKQADTIKELCDCFVFKKEIYRKIEKRNDLEGVPMIRMFDIHFFDLYEDEWERIYGAIWVKGEHNEPILKSVAEMNEKGELELL